MMWFWNPPKAWIELECWLGASDHEIGKCVTKLRVPSRSVPTWVIDEVAELSVADDGTTEIMIPTYVFSHRWRQLTRGDLGKSHVYVPWVD